MFKLAKIALPVVALLVLAGFTAFVSPAQAQNTVTITFDGGEGNPASYTESGMTVTALDGSLAFSLGPVVGLLMSDSIGETYTFDFGGRRFTVVSVHYDRFSSDAGASTFTSSDDAVEVITISGIHEFPAGGWTDITSFTWVGPDRGPEPDALCCVFGIDDLVVDIPGPPSSCPSGFSLVSFTPPGTGPDSNGNGLVCEKAVGRGVTVDDINAAPP